MLCGSFTEQISKRDDGAIMNGFACKTCPLAFEVGYYGRWDLSGCCSQYVCCQCGTMHRIEHPNGKPDVLFALAAPIEAMIEVVRKDFAGQEFNFTELPVSEHSWRRIGELPTSRVLQDERVFPKRASGVQLDRLRCSFCATVGRLVSLEWPKDDNGNWPIFGDRCPKCGEKLVVVYVTTIN
jgi:hypothetical protein